MADSSPPKPRERSSSKGDEKDGDGERAVALGAVRRVYRSRQRARARSRARRGKSRGVESDASGESDDEDEQGVVTQNTSNHYTLNMPGSVPHQSDLPYVLLGYLQFFFNLSLILVFLYLLVQFIITVQRDVEHRISEYSMGAWYDVCLPYMHSRPCRDRTRDRPMRAAAQSEPVRFEFHTRDGAPMCDVGDLHEPRPVQGRARARRRRAHRGSSERLRRAHKLEDPRTSPLPLSSLSLCRSSDTLRTPVQIFILTSLAFLTVFINALLSLYRSRINPATHAPPPMPAFPLAPPIGYPAHAPDWGKAAWAPAEDDVPGTPSRRRRLESGTAEKIR